MTRRITQRDIAREAGVDVSTVCLSLNGHPRIPAATRERITALAREMGYRPDPALSSIAMTRWQGRRDVKGLVIGFLGDPKADTEIEARIQEAGAREQAKALGYGLERFSIAAYPSPEKLARVLRARGIRGLIVAQTRKQLDEDALRNLPVPFVRCGYLHPVEGDVVRPDLRAAVEGLVHHLLPRFAPLAFFLPLDRELHSDRVILGAALCCAAENKQIRVIQSEDPPAKRDFNALARAKPGAVVVINERHAQSLQKSDALPQKTPVYTLHTLPPFDGKQGMNLRMHEVGRIAVNLLEFKMRQLPWATPPFQQSLLIAPEYRR
jgi:DNA-binding LacI/PurR family transcriptional regulator